MSMSDDLLSRAQWELLVMEQHLVKIDEAEDIEQEHETIDKVLYHVRHLKRLVQEEIKKRDGENEMNF